MVKRIIALVLTIFLCYGILVSCDFSAMFNGAYESPDTGDGTDDDDDDDGNDNNASVDWENRWSVLEDKLDNEAIDAIKSLYAFYDDSVYEWMANLWSFEIGGFYYSNSARDYEGFLPDLESTRQVLAIIRTSGMVDIYGSDSDKAFASVFPDELKNKIVGFVKSCQSAEDGYFYHPQWKTVGTSRRGRDLDWAIELLELFGEKPDYPTALDRLSGATAGAYSVLHQVYPPSRRSPK